MHRRLAIALLFLLAACGRPPPHEAPPPQEPTREAVGYYCGMIVVDHRGPKGQVWLEGRGEPLWFTSVRDTLVFLRSPEEPKSVVAVYVNDMGRADWDAPQPGTWIDAHQAWYVLGSDRRGGMGAPEAVPFAERAAAEAFARRHGGRILRLDEIPDQWVFAPVPDEMPHDPGR